MLSRRQFLGTVPLLTLAGCSRKSSEEPFWAGHVGPLNGSDRAAGEHFKRGILLALEEVNEGDNRVAGRRLAVLHADSRGDIERARHEAVRLVSLNKLAALLGGRDQATANRLAQVLQPYPVSLLTPAPHGPASLENAFSIDVAPEFRGESLARFAVDRFKVQRAIILVDDTTPACATAASAFAEQWRSGGGRSVQTWDARAEEMAKVLPEKLRKEKAEMLFFAGRASDLLGVRASLPATLPIVFGGEPSEWQRLEVQAGQGTFGATVHAPARFDDDGKSFLKRYREKHHEEADASACQGYELTCVLAAAMRSVKGADPVKVREELGNDEEEFPALTGKLRFKKGHAIRPLFVMRAGQASPERTFEPGTKVPG
jgi:ABC-type branched-subunit amino acid transport system substrate-binding protein